MQKNEIKALQKFITFISLISVALFIIWVISLIFTNISSSFQYVLLILTGLGLLLLVLFSLKLSGKLKNLKELINDDILCKYNLVNEKAEDLFFFISKDGKLLDVSDNVERLIGYPRDEFVGKDFREIIHEGDIVRCAGYISRIFTGAQKQKNVRYRVKLYNGGWAWYIANGIPVFSDDGRVESVFGIARDMTELINAEAALTESEKLNKEIIENAPTGMVYLNQSREIAACNSRFRTIFGIPGAIGVGHKLASFAGCEVLDEILNRIYDGEFLSGEIVSVSGKSALKMDAAPHFNNNGSVSGAVILFEDTEEAKTLDRFLSRSRKLESIGTLAGGITHDFNNILTAILGFTDLLLSSSRYSEQDKELLQEVFKAGKRAEALIKQLLQFTRQPDELPKPIELQHIIKEIVKLLKSTFPAHIKIKSAIDTHAGFVEASLSRFHQMVISASMCAYYYLKNKGGEFQICYGKNSEIESDKYIQLSVNIFPSEQNDTENGLEKFKSINRKAISLIDAISKSFGGSLEVVLTGNMGIAVKINLPLINDEIEDKEEKLDRYKTGSGHIMFVDDEAPIRRVIKEAMRVFGYSVTVFGNPEEALSVFNNNPEEFDYLITDQNMPEMHGIDLARKVLEIKQDTPVIICTGYDESLTDKVIKETGVRKLVIKPVLAAQLHEIIQEITEKG